MLSLNYYILKVTYPQKIDQCTMSIIDMIAIKKKWFLKSKNGGTTDLHWLPFVTLFDILPLIVCNTHSYKHIVFPITHVSTLVVCALTPPFPLPRCLFTPITIDHDHHFLNSFVGWERTRVAVLLLFTQGHQNRSDHVKG